MEKLSPRHEAVLEAIIHLLAREVVVPEATLVCRLKAMPSCRAQARHRLKRRVSDLIECGVLVRDGDTIKCPGLPPDDTTQLLYHAGFAREVKLEVPSLADALRRKASITASVNDVIRLLALLNHEVNGLVPSASIAVGKQNHFSRKLVFAITEIIDLLRDAEKVSDGEISRAHRQIAFAWSSVVAGDIDDIHQEIEWNDAARS